MLIPISIPLPKPRYHSLLKQFLLHPVLVSQAMTTSIISHARLQDPSGKLNWSTKSSENSNGATTTVYLTIFVFRGKPDTHFNRHVIIYFTSQENQDFHETILVQRPYPNGPWGVVRMTTDKFWPEEKRYLSHVNAKIVRVRKGQESALVDIIGAIPLENREADWNCQNFVLEGLQEIVNQGYEAQEWYDYVEDELMTQLVTETVG
ncbi:hypothetical protein F4782DRAFT_511777 [Xylaria castorea]|nr:hypothetical protein F4782DRAFT_511777 [Xylaria castorea]